MGRTAGTISPSAGTPIGVSAGPIVAEEAPSPAPPPADRERGKTEHGSSAPLSPSAGGGVGGGGSFPRLLYVATSKSDGGIERYSVQLAAELARQDYSVSYACLPYGPVWEACGTAGIPTLPLVLRNSGDAHAAFQLAAHITQARADIVHVHSRRDFLPALFAVQIARRRASRSISLVLHAHMMRPLGQPARLSGRVFGRGADAILCVSDAVRELLTRGEDVPASKVFTLHNGVDLTLFGTAQAARERPRTRRALELNADALVLTMVGRLDAKGQATLVNALPTLAARFPSVRVLLMGADGKPGERARLTERARAGGVCKRVTFTGPRADVSQLLAASDVFIHLPTDEAFGLSLAEAMAAGLPCVASDVGGCPEITRHGVTGFTVPANDPDALCAALDPLLCGDGGRRLRFQMGAAGRSVAEAEFSLSAQVEKLRAIYAALHVDTRHA